jgi:hypothetical protein
MSLNCDIYEAVLESTETTDLNVISSIKSDLSNMLYTLTAGIK